VLPVVVKLFARNLAFWTGKRTTFYGLTRTSKHFKPDLEALFGLLHDGKIMVPIKATFPLEEIQAAHREYARSAGLGSIILAVNA
jgi:NADPH:quinone reductase-like Zn-dependent oxidoreductase